MKNIATQSTIVLFFILFSANFLYGASVLTVTMTPPTTDQDCINGEFNLNINKGFPPFEVTWYRLFGFNGSVVPILVQQNGGLLGTDNSGEDFENAVAGQNYKVVVVDALCGRISKRVRMEQCQCNGNSCTVKYEKGSNAWCKSPGYIAINVDCINDVGDESFSYLWSNGATTKNIYGLNPGTYCVTVTDDQECAYSNCFEVGGEPFLQIGIVDKGNTRKCDEDGDACEGFIDIEVTNGAGGYIYLWSNGSSSQDVDDLCEGTYTVTVTDSGGCEQSLSVDICCCSSNFGSNLSFGNCFANTNLAPLSIDYDISGFPNPYIDVVVTGGTGDYACYWEDPTGNIIFSCMGLGSNEIRKEGEYCLTVNDGCSSISECYDIVDCERYDITANADILETCENVLAGSITLNVSGGTSPYTIEWNNGDTGHYIDGLGVGQYCATIKDFNGCEALGTYCYIVGEVPGAIVYDSEECSRTIECNGEKFTDYSSFIPSLDCNILSMYCPLTGETTYEDLGYAFTYYSESDCVQYDICQDGTLEFNSQGSLETGPFWTNSPNCPEEVGCADYACRFSDGTNLIVGSIYCSNVVYVRDDVGCGFQKCRADIYCGNTLMGSYCTEYVCPYNKLGTPLPDKIVLMDMNAMAYLKSDDLEITPKPLKLDGNLTVYPNPTKDKIFIEHSYESRSLRYSIVSTLGKTLITRNMDSDKSIEIDISHLSSGIYFLVISDSKGILESTKIIKN
ncbi:MAG: hypothetical protein ACI94Y_001161 [Maribacter sp.]|jgi:hypothetical protein